MNPTVHPAQPDSRFIPHGNEQPESAGSGASIPVARLDPVRNEQRASGLRLTSLADLLAEPVEAVQWVVDGLLPVGGVSVLAGKPKAGKSTLARAIALAVARGAPVLGRATAQGPVIYLAHEDRRADVAEHFRAMGGADEPILVHCGAAPADPAEGVGQLAELVRACGAQLAVIDTLNRFVRVRELSEYGVVGEALEPVLTLARESGCHVMVVHHAGKAERPGMDSVLGSSAIVGTGDVTLLLKRRADGTRTLATEQRTGDDLPESVVTLDDHRMPSMAGTVAANDAQSVRERIHEAIEETDGATETDIRATVGGDSGAVGRELRAMVERGELRRTGRGGRGGSYRYSLPDSSVAETANGKPGTTDGRAGEPPEPDAGEPGDLFHGRPTTLAAFTR